ncbi:MAG: DinB family protein [Bacteroidota bacterium]|nr:DinB family protein [Bacteroidota bacterium]
MFKKNKGYILLALLVITGLASQVTNDTLNNKERKFLVRYLKETKAAFFASTEDLSEKQLNFKPASDKWSIKEYIQHQALTERKVWVIVDSILKQRQSTEPQAFLKVEDERLIYAKEDWIHQLSGTEAKLPPNTKWKTTDEAKEAFKKDRTNVITYVKTTTDNVRTHVAKFPYGHLDAYQLMLIMAIHTQQHIRQIEAIKNNPAFPK